MIKAIRHIGLLILLLLAGRMAAQTPVIDSVCQGAVRYYRVNGLAGSTYSWILTSPLGDVELLPSDADTLGITWNYDPGLYQFEVLQHSEFGCIADPVFGYILIFESPDVFAGNDDLICANGFYHLINSIAQNTSALLWTTSGDGAFDNDTILHPAYTPGVADIFNGFVTLTLTGFGEGDDGTCEPVSSSLILTIVSVLAEVEDVGDASCYGLADGWVQLAANGGYEPYTYTVNGSSNETGLFDNLAAGDYNFSVTDFNGCEYEGTFTIGEPPAMAADYTFTPATCFGNNDGSITIFDAEGGSGVYGYSIDGITWQDNGLFTNLAPGIYTALLRDANAVNCIIVVAEEIDIAGPDVLQADVAFTNVSCFGIDDGSITISNPSGGSGLYEYSIDGSVWQPGGLFAGLAPGIYNAMIRDFEQPGCMILLEVVEISEPGEPFAFAGNDDEMCSSQGSYALSGEAANFNSLLWESSGSGNFDDPTILTATYTPSADDIDAGFVTLILTAITGGDCEDASDTMVLTIIRAAWAYAGPDASICEGDTFTITGSDAEDYVSLLWSHNGLGTLLDETTLTPTYIPAAGETGTVTLLLTAVPGGNGSCPDAVDSMNLSIILAPLADAGPDTAICAGDSYTLSGYANMAVVEWTTSGTGTFDDPNSLAAIYTPGIEDIQAGYVTLTLTAYGEGSCPDVSDEMVLTIYNDATAYAGADITICEGASYTVPDAIAENYLSVLWTHDGQGVLVDETTLTPTYIPEIGETGAITLTLTVISESAGLCPDATDSMVITITEAPVVYAGPDADICAGEANAVSGQSNMSQVLWTTSGDGVFDDPTALQTTYTPGSFDVALGQVILTLTATGNEGCEDVSDSVLLTIWMQAYADAGSDAVICEGENYTVNNAFAAGHTGLLWTHDGTGTLINETTLTPTYIPAIGETGTVTLTLTVYPQAVGICPEAIDDMVITIISAPTANAGEDAEICEGDSYTLAGESNVPTIEWTTSGTGTFDDPTVLNATYFPGQEDMDAGSVTLTLFAYGNVGCGDASDEMTLSIRKNALAFAGEDAYTCEEQPYQVNDAWATNYASMLWSHNGLGILTDETTLNPIYQPAAGETGTVTLTLTVVPEGNGVCPDVTDSMNIFILNAPIVDAGDDAEICSSDSYELAGSAFNYVSAVWTSSGDGIFSDPTSLTATYAPGTDDIDAGQVTLTLTATGSGSCGETSDELILTIWKQAIADAGPDLEVCEGHSITITEAAALNYDSLYWWHNGTGTLTDSTTITPTYTPGVNDASVITLVLHVVPFGDGICPVATDTMSITVVTMPQVYAGADAEICEGDNYLLSGVAENYASVGWATSGDGTFDNAASLLATYFPGEDDIAAGQVTLTLTAYGMGTCDDVSDELLLIIVPQVVAFAGEDASICVGDTYHLAGATASHAASFEWTTSGSGTFSDPGILNPVYTPGIEDIQAGSVVLTLTAFSPGNTGTCPPAVAQMTLTISSPVITNLQTSPSIDNQPVGWVLITVIGGTPPYEYSLDGINWQPGSIITDLLAGAYTAWVRDANGCIDTKEFNIFNLVLGEVEVIAGAINSCVNSTLDAAVMATGFMNIAMFNLKLDFDPAILHLETLIDINPALLNGLISFSQPNPGSVVITFTSNVPTTIPSDENLFRVEFTGINAGQSTLLWDRPECYFFASSGYVVPSIYITGLVVVHPEPQIAATGSGEYCEGEPLTLTVSSLDQQNLNYEWTGPDGSRNYGPAWNIGSLDVRHSGNFTVTAINDAGCHSEMQIPVKVNMLPEVYLAASDTTCIDDQPLLLEPGIWYTSYRWQDGSTSSSYLVTQEGLYWVEVTDENGCKNLASVFIMPCDIELLIPNAFTPNGDGLNDEFGPIVPLVELPNYTMLIFNRWGQQLFETRDIRKGWDGTVNGQLMPMDVYSYVIIYELPSYYNNRTPRKLMGSVMLMR